MRLSHFYRSLFFTPAVQGTFWAMLSISVALLFTLIQLHIIHNWKLFSKTTVCSGDHRAASLNQSRDRGMVKGVPRRERRCCSFTFPGQNHPAGLGIEPVTFTAEYCKTTSTLTVMVWVCCSVISGLTFYRLCPLVSYISFHSLSLPTFLPFFFVRLCFICLLVLVYCFSFTLCWFILLLMCLFPQPSCAPCVPDLFPVALSFVLHFCLLFWILLVAFFVTCILYNVFHMSR